MPKLGRFAPSVLRYLDASVYLEALYQSRKGEEKSYSYLEFAEELGFSRTNVIHLVIRGKRPLSVKAGEKIAEALDWKGLERRYWLNLVAYHASSNEVDREHLMAEMVEIKAREIKDNPMLQYQLEFLTEWYHSIIFEIGSLAQFTEDPKELSGMLEPKIRPEQAKRSLELLENLGFFKRVNGQLRPAEVNLSTGDEIASLAVVRYHQNMIDLGRRSISTIDEKLRDVSSVSFACPESLAMEVKREISIFRKKILALSEAATGKDRVYQMNVQLFPVTRQKGSDR